MRKIVRQLPRWLHNVEWIVSLWGWAKERATWLVGLVVSVLATMSWGDVVPWMLTGIVIAGWVLLIGNRLWRRRDPVDSKGTPPSDPLDDTLTEVRRLLEDAAEWIVKVEPKDHNDGKESLRFSFNLEKVYGFLEDAFVPRYHEEARDYAKKHGGRAEALSDYLNQLSLRITAEELDPSFHPSQHRYEPIA